MFVSSPETIPRGWLGPRHQIPQISTHCSQEGEAGTEGSTQVLTPKNWNSLASCRSKELDQR